MGKNIKGGKKSKKFASKREAEYNKRPFLTIEPEGQVYAKVIKKQGGSPPIVELLCSDKETRVGVCCKKLKRMKMWADKDCIVLVNLRDYQPKRCDVIWVYNDDEIAKLVYQGEISAALTGTKTTEFSSNMMDEVDATFEFAYAEDTKESEESEKSEKPKKPKKEGSSSSSESESESDESEEFNINEI